MKLNLSFVLFTILAVLNAVQGLRDECNIQGKTYGAGCPTDNPACCARQGRCAVVYSLQALWLTELDVTSKPNLYTCAKQCQRHFRKCVGKCKCLSYTDESRTKGACKCVRSPKFPAKKVFSDCSKSCKKARKFCRLRCLKGLSAQKCLLRASTKVAWESKYPGTCKRICKPIAGVLEKCVVPILPVKEASA